MRGLREAANGDTRRIAILRKNKLNLVNFDLTEIEVRKCGLAKYTIACKQKHVPINKSSMLRTV